MLNSEKTLKVAWVILDEVEGSERRHTDKLLSGKLTYPGTLFPTNTAAEYHLEIGRESTKTYYISIIRVRDMGHERRAGKDDDEVDVWCFCERKTARHGIEKLPTSHLGNYDRKVMQHIFRFICILIKHLF